MAQSLSKILVHTVFSTKARQPFLHDGAVRSELNRYVGGILVKLDCQPIIVGGVEDHVHLLCALSRTWEASRLVQEVKRGFSLWLKTKHPILRTSRGKAATAFFPSAIRRSKSLALTSPNKSSISFQDEFRRLLNRYEITFDERYVWD